MDICQVETGLLMKKPCGQPGVTKCLNCEQALCSKHAVAQLNEGGNKTGKFMCKECAAAQKEAAKIAKAVAASAPAGAKKPDAPAAAAPKPAAPKPPPPKPAAPAPAAAKPAAAPPKPGAKPELSLDDSGPIEFTPSKPPADKK